MRFLAAATVCILASACNNSDSRVTTLEDKVESLEAQLATLQTQLDALQAQSDTNSTNVESMMGTVADAADLLTVMSIDSDGDVAITGANLKVSSGAANTNSPPNGKGNIVIGVDEPGGTCVGGIEDGQRCTPSGEGNECTGGTCDVSSPVTVKTGSHNLVIGRGHSYSGSGNIVGGDVNDAQSNGGALFGGGNGAGDRYVFVAGNGNTADGQAASVLGGSQNTASGASSSILGGQGNSTTATDEILP